MFVRKIPVSGDYAKKHKIQFHGITHQVSPFDIPLYAIARYDEEKMVYSIEFVYLTPDEPKEEQIIDHYTKIFVGKNSKKLYLIKVDGCTRDNIPALNIHIIQEVEKLIPSEENLKDLVKKMNYQIIKDFLENEKGTLFNI